MHPDWDAETSGDEADDFELCFLWNVGRSFVAAPDQQSRHPPPLRRALGTDRNVDAAVQQYAQPGHAFEPVRWAPPRPPTPHPGLNREIQGPGLGNLEHVTEEVQQGASRTAVVISSSSPGPAHNGVASRNLAEHGQEDNNTYRRNPILHPVHNRAVPAGNTEDGPRQQEAQSGRAGTNLLYVRRPSSIYRRTPSGSTWENSATEATDTTDEREGAPSSKMPRMSE